MSTARETAPWPPYTFRAHDVRTGSANRMHQDGLATRLGFRGGFVTGAAYYGRMTRELVQRFGPDWLERGIVEMAFPKPVHEGDPLTVSGGPLPERAHERACLLRGHNADGVEVVRVESWLPDPFPAPDALAAETPADWEGAPRAFSLDTLELFRPYRANRFRWSLEDNLFWCRELDDAQAVYAEGPRPPLHPALVVRCLKQREFATDGVQVTNRLTIHRALRVGEEIELLTVPVEKFEKKGNAWVVLYCAARVGGIVALEAIQHKILRMRGAA